MGRSQAKAACDDLSSPKEDRHAIASETREFLAELHPVRRKVEIKDIIDAILFLESATLMKAGPARRPMANRSLPAIRDKASRRRTTRRWSAFRSRGRGRFRGYTRVTREQTALLIEGVSRLLLDVLNKSMNSTFVVIDELDVEKWDREVFLSRNAESEWLPRPMSPIPSSWASRRNEHRAYTASHDGCRSRRLKFGSS